MDSLSLVPCGEAISVTAGGIYSTANTWHSKITCSKNMCFFLLFFFFQIIYLKFVSVASDHFSFEATFETMVDPQFLQQPGQGSSHLLVFLKDILALLLRFSGL